MSYEDLISSNIPLVTLDFINDAISKFKYIRDFNKRLDNDDCVDLSFIFTILTNDLFYTTKKILNKHNINEYDLATNYKFVLNNLKNAKNPAEKSKIYNNNFKNIIDELINDKQINELYPEDILIDMMGYVFCDELFYKLGITKDNEQLLKKDLLTNKNRRKNRIYLDYKTLKTGKLPFLTKSSLEFAFIKYNDLFVNKEYNENVFSKEEDKIIFCLIYSLINDLYDTNFIKKINLNSYDILKTFNMPYISNINNIELERLEEEKIYDEHFKEFLNHILNSNDIFNTLDYDLKNIYPESLYLAIGFDNDFANNFYKIFGISDEDVNTFKKELYKSLEKRITTKQSKFFDIDDYSNPFGNIHDDLNKDDHYKNGSYEEFQKKYKNSKKNYSVLEDYGDFLDEREYIKNPAIGREEEIKKIILTLLTPDKSSLLVGEAGVGKTAIVEGLAYLLKNGKVPEILKNKKIISISTTSLISGCKYVGMVEERMKKILNELEENKEIILFIDEIHTIVGAGQGKNGNNDISNILKPYLDRGSIKIIGSTTEDEYNNIMNDSAFRRRFEKTVVKELDNDKIKLILKEEISKLETIYNIKFDFNKYEINSIINILISLTSDKNKTYYDKVNNPDLVLSILKKAFVLSIYNERDKVMIDDIKEAINMCDRIYNSVKYRELIKLDNLKCSEEKPIKKIIKFPINYS